MTGSFRFSLSTFAERPWEFLFLFSFLAPWRFSAETREEERPVRSDRHNNSTSSSSSGHGYVSVLSLQQAAAGPRPHGMPAWSRVLGYLAPVPKQTR